MSYVCPVCNGLYEINAACPNCRSNALDSGKFSDLYGPYSPYRPIDDLKMSNGFTDLEDRQCIHVYYCPECNHSFLVTLEETQYP